MKKIIITKEPFTFTHQFMKEFCEKHEVDRVSSVTVEKKHLEIECDGEGNLSETLRGSLGKWH